MLLSLGTPCKNFNLYYSGDNRLDAESTFDQEEKNKIPLVNPYCSILEFHKEKLVYDVLLILNEIFPELFVYYDEEGWFGKAEKFKQFIS